MKKSEYIHGVQPEEQERLRLLNRLTNPAFLDFLQISDGDRVLEIGSGLGIMAEAVAAVNPSGKVTGIEYAAEQIAAIQNHRRNLEFVQGDAHHLPFGPGTFDVVYGRYILEHLGDPFRAIQEAYRVIKPGGKVFFQENTISIMKLYPPCPVFAHIWQQFIVLQDQLGGDAEIGIKLYSLLKRAGFRELRLSVAEEIHYAEKGTLIAWIDNIIGNVRSAEDKLIELGLASRMQIDQAAAELETFKNDPLASAYFFWNRISGKK